MAYFRCRGIRRDPIFGDGSLGDVILTTETWNAPTEDTGVIEKCFKTLEIPSGVTITAGNRNSGIIIRCQGNCTINGSIINSRAPKSHSADLSSYYPSWMVNNGAGGNGSSGGNGRSYESSQSSGGSGQVGRYYGGGYSGGGGGGGSGYNTSSSWGSGSSGANGGSATGINTSVANIFVGGGVTSAGSYGGGGGGRSYSSTYYGGAGGSGAGGSGGSCYGKSTSKSWYTGGSGGGAGNYGGGVIIIFCGGILTINGSIVCKGANGGSAGGSNIGSESLLGGAGGGAGGGRIYLLYKKSIAISSATLNVNGGTGANTGGTGTKYKIDYRDYNKGAGIPTAL